jgi:hypothetical protein
MRKRKQPNNNGIDREKWADDLMGRYGQLQDMLDRTPISEIEWKSDNTSLFLPIQRFFAKTIGLDLVEVKPMSAPMGTLHYFDTELIYSDEEQIDMDAEKWMRKNIVWEIIKSR